LVRRFLRAQPIEIGAVRVNQSTIEVEINARIGGEADISVVDILGQTVAHEKRVLPVGSINVGLAAPLVTGSYVVRVEAAGFIRSKHLQIVR
jgi:hypothetical protein